MTAMLGRLEVAARRAAMLVAVLRGRMDYVADAVEQKVAAEQALDRVRKMLEKQQMQTRYWYTLWWKMSREYAAGQARLCDYIDQLRQRIPGEWDEQEYAAKLEQAGMTTGKFSHPVNHPVDPDDHAPDFKVEYPPNGCPEPPPEVAQPKGGRSKSVPSKPCGCKETGRRPPKRSTIKAKEKKDGRVRSNR